MAYDNPRPSSQPVGSVDLAVAKDDLITLDIVVAGSASDEVTNRKGLPLRTLAGIEADAVAATDAVVDQFNTDSASAINQFNTNGTSAINQFNANGQQAIDDFNDIANNLVNSVGYEIVGDFADAVKVPITAENQVYSSKAVANQEDALWRTNQPLPYTPTGSDPTIAPEFGKWAAVALGEIKVIARSLNALDSQVIYSTDTVTALDDVLYIYDAIAQRVWAKPSSVGAGETIISVVGDALTTSAAVYTLIKLNRHLTLSYSDAKNYPLTIGDTVSITDRGYASFNVMPSGVDNDATIIVANNGLYLHIIPQNGQLTLEQIGCAGDVNPSNNTSGTLGNSLRINAALSLVSLVSLRGSDGLYLLDDNITIPAGKEFVGLFCGLDSSYKTNNAPNLMRGSWLVSRGAQILMSDNTRLSGFGQWYDQQNYDLQYDAGQPDGIESWTIYPPSIEFVGSYSSVEIIDMIPLGMTHWFAAKTTAHNVEKPRIKRIVGMPLLVGIEIDLSSDIVRFKDIHFNPNSLFNLPNYTPTAEKSAKYVRNFEFFRVGRVDGGFIENCFGFAGRDFIHFKYDPAHLDAVGGSLRLSCCASDVYHNFIRVEQTARGFGIEASNCWGALTVWDIYDPSGGVVNRRPCIVRFGDDAASVVVGTEPALENAHVTINGFKRFGQSTSGIPGTARPAEPFAFDSPDGKRLSIIASDVQIDEHSTYAGGLGGGAALFGAPLSDNLQRLITVSNSTIRDFQTDTWDVLQAVQYESKGTSYGKVFNTGCTDVLGTDTQAFFEYLGREFSDPNEFGVKGVFKNASNLIKLFQAFRGSQILIDVDRDSGNTSLPVGLWDGGHLVIGNIHLWNEGVNLRVKSGAPTSATDGVILGA